MGVDESEGVGAHATTAVGVSWAQAQAGGWLYGEAAYVSASSSAIPEAEAGERRASVNVCASRGAETVGLWCARSGPMLVQGAICLSAFFSFSCLTPFLLKRA